LARKIAWTVVISAVYGVEAIWEGQKWLLDGFNKLSTPIGRAVADTFSKDTIRAANIPPTELALNRRSKRLLIAAMATPVGTPKRLLLPCHPEDDSSRHRISKWFSTTDGSSEKAKG
jgi:hypothetical protein